MKTKETKARIPLRNKAQIFTWDIILATCFFLLVLAMLLFQWSTIISEIMTSEAQYEISWLSTAVSEQLVRTTGYPVDWAGDPQYSGRLIYGLADTEEVYEEVRVMDRVLDPDKFVLFINHSGNYSYMRNRLLSSGTYDYYIELSCLSEHDFDCFNNQLVDYIENASVNCTNNVSINVSDHRIKTFDPAAVLVWRFDEGQGDYVYDGTGNDGRGTLINGTAWTSGRYGSALRFDGANDCVRGSNASLLAGAENLTISAWIYANRLGTYNTLVNKAYSYLLTINSVGRIQVWNGTGSSWSSSLLISSSNISLGSWHHVAITSDSSGSYAYIDGVLRGTGNSLGTIPSNDYLPEVGSRSYEPTYLQPFNGTIDDLMIYNRALSSLEISSEYSTGRRICLLGRNVTVNETTHITNDVKTFTFSRNKSTADLYEDLPMLNASAKLKVVVYKKER